MEIVPYSEDCRDDWNALCEATPDAWFWHTRDWFDYAREFSGSGFLADTSMMVRDGNHLIALAPCMALGACGERGQLGLADQPVPWPAFSAHLDKAARRRAEELLFGGYAAIARKWKLGRIELFGVVLARSFYRASFPPANLPLRYGYRGRVFDTQVLDLTQPVDRLWGDVRKGHRAAIRSAQRTFAIRCWHGKISDEDFRHYQELHALAAGRVTRMQSTFDAMCDWIRSGKGLLIGASLDDQWISFVYILRYQAGAFYASACNHPTLAARLSVSHALLWEAVLRCRELGVELFEMGKQTYPTDGACLTDDKLVSISSYKRGFGGFAMPRFHAELDLSQPPLSISRGH